MSFKIVPAVKNYDKIKDIKDDELLSMKSCIVSIIKHNRLKIKYDEICIHINCTQKAIYGDYIDGLNVYCLEHKKENMVDVTNIIYPQNSNNVQGYEDQKYCKYYNTNNMIKMIRPICSNKNCNELANFRFQGDKNSYCDIHKKKDMVHLYDNF